MARKKDAPVDRDMQGIINWIRDGLRRKQSSQAALARHLGLPTSRISEVMHGRRFLRAVELQRASVYLDAPIPRSAVDAPLSVVREVFVIGSVGMDWVSGDLDDYRARRPLGIIASGQYTAAQQMGFDVDHALPEHDLLRGDIIIGAAIDAVPLLTAGQLVVIERSMGELRNYAVGRITDGPARTYDLLSPPYKGRHTSRIVALVLATYRPR